jgi:hypothetical protein
MQDADSNKLKESMKVKRRFLVLENIVDDGSKNEGMEIAGKEITEQDTQ